MTYILGIAAQNAANARALADSKTDPATFLAGIQTVNHADKDSSAR